MAERTVVPVPPGPGRRASPAELRELVEELRAERDRLLDQLARGQRMEHETSEEAAEPGDMADVGAALRDIDRFERVDDVIARRLDAIQAALDRAAQNRLGLCERCGDPIDPARLRALPDVSVCRECADEVELENRKLSS